MTPSADRPPVGTQELSARLAELGAQVDRWTREALAAAISPPAARFGAMLEYHLGWRDAELHPLPVPAPSGKKLRPALALLACEAVCGDATPARDAAVAVELVHNFSLAHDDIQDRSELRRHRPALWSLWGAEQGINAGDALFALGRLALLRARTARSAALAAELDLASVRLAEGQFLDLELQRGSTPPTPSAYEAMIARKTGALFECAGRLGAMAGQAPPATVEAYASFGRELGVAFQEQDDLLGVWGRAEDTGKPEAADVRSRKKGLPAVAALARPDAPAWLRQAYAAADGELPPPLAARVIAHFDRLELRAAIEERVERRHRAALAALEAAGGREPARSQLAALCETLVARRA